MRTEIAVDVTAGDRGHLLAIATTATVRRNMSGAVGSCC